jgi:hypothetical protein
MASDSFSSYGDEKEYRNDIGEASKLSTTENLPWGQTSTLLSPPPPVAKIMADSLLGIIILPW